MKKEHKDSNVDAEALKGFHYKQELKRTVQFFGAFAVAFSAISITTGTFQNFGLVMKTIGPLGIWTFPIVGFGSTLIALIFCELASLIPVTGQCYMWVSKFYGKGLGWFVGWITFCYMIVIIPSVSSSLGPVLASLLGVEATPHFVTIVAITALTLHLILNIFSVKLSSLITSAAVVTESVGILLLTIVLAVVAFRHGAPVSNLVAVNPTVSGKSLFVPFLMSSLMGFYTLVAFESAANMSEETHNASKSIPKAMVASIVLSTIFGTLFLIFSVLSAKNLPAVYSSDSPLPLIIESNLGSVIGKLFLIIVIVSIFACGLAFMTSASRTIYAMARDDAFFASSIFKKVEHKRGTPIPACILLWACAVLFSIFSTPTVLAVASASLPCVYYLITLISYACVRKKIKFKKENFNLGKFAAPLLVITILWQLVALGILSIPSDFRSATLVNICLAAVGGIIYFAYFKNKLKNNDDKGTELIKEDSDVV
ncbi:APC family permease [Inconstantimicrobium mannanitabidum]|uniref:Amino acid permease n=1 Tax=Inconstantimicrobium mannanitabidum TaxID=1604901 RepID=A0ACB5R7J4_9CLOT|nr:amino acid permease [Clostridium sp. TW13]GKX65160.1 amino acid permease [Clostridium sp. TW13]